MDDYYKILELDKSCKKIEIKKQYHKLSLKYHPDKNGDNEKFIKIHEAYETLYDDEKRKIYDVKLTFRDIDLTEDDYNIIFSYYNRFVESYEYKLMMLLYKSIPKDVKEKVIKKFKYRNTKLVCAQKSIDITYLDYDISINLVMKIEEYEGNVLKIIYLFTRYGVYYLYIRKPPNKLVFDNLNNKFTINFFII
jgi:hypothetical protein